MGAFFYFIVKIPEESFILWWQWLKKIMKPNIHFRETFYGYIGWTWCTNGDLVYVRFNRFEDPYDHIGNEYWIVIYIGPAWRFPFSNQVTTYGGRLRGGVEGMTLAYSIMQVFYKDYMDRGDWMCVKGSDEKRDILYERRLWNKPIVKDGPRWILSDRYCCEIRHVLILHKGWPREGYDTGFKTAQDAVEGCFLALPYKDGIPTRDPDEYESELFTYPEWKVYWNNYLKDYIRKRFNRLKTRFTRFSRRSRGKYKAG